MSKLVVGSPSREELLALGKKRLALFRSEKNNLIPNNNNSISNNITPQNGQNGPGPNPITNNDSPSINKVLFHEGSSFREEKEKTIDSFHSASNHINLYPHDINQNSIHDHSHSHDSNILHSDSSAYPYYNNSDQHGEIESSADTQALAQTEANPHHQQNEVEVEAKEESSGLVDSDERRLLEELEATYQQFANHHIQTANHEPHQPILKHNNYHNHPNNDNNTSAFHQNQFHQDRNIPHDLNDLNANNNNININHIESRTDPNSFNPNSDDLYNQSHSHSHNLNHTNHIHSSTSVPNPNGKLLEDLDNSNSINMEISKLKSLLSDRDNKISELLKDNHSLLNEFETLEEEFSFYRKKSFLKEKEISKQMETVNHCSNFIKNRVFELQTVNQALQILCSHFHLFIQQNQNKFYQQNDASQNQNENETSPVSVQTEQNTHSNNRDNSNDDTSNNSKNTDPIITWSNINRYIQSIEVSIQTKNDIQENIIHQANYLNSFYEQSLNSSKENKNKSEASESDDNDDLKKFVEKIDSSYEKQLKQIRLFIDDQNVRLTALHRDKIMLAKKIEEVLEEKQFLQANLNNLANTQQIKYTDSQTLPNEFNAVNSPNHSEGEDFHNIALSPVNHQDHILYPNDLPNIKEGGTLSTGSASDIHSASHSASLKVNEDVSLTESLVSPSSASPDNYNDNYQQELAIEAGSITQHGTNLASFPIQHQNANHMNNSFDFKSPEVKMEVLERKAEEEREEGESEGGEGVFSFLFSFLFPWRRRPNPKSNSSSASLSSQNHQPTLIQTAIPI